MRRLILVFFTSMLLFIMACTQDIAEQPVPSGLVLVKGGQFVNQKSNLYGKGAIISDFYIGKYEVTQKEWKEVMNTNPSQFKGDDLPVEMVSWYDCVVFCNKKSIKEGLIPFYTIDKETKDELNKSEYDNMKWTVAINAEADGYRLPTEAEWEYAASGGQLSKSFSFSGSNDINEVAWYWRNCGDSILTEGWNYKMLEQNNGKTHRVGSKQPNELGLYDMTGNVREWCEDWYEDYENPKGLFRSQRGGGWIGVEQHSTFAERGNFEANGIGPDQGFRLSRNK